MKSSAHLNKISDFLNYKPWTNASSVSHTHRQLVGGLPGAGRGVCSGGPLLAVLRGRVIHSVTGQHGEDEVWRLGAEI